MNAVIIHNLTRSAAGIRHSDGPFAADQQARQALRRMGAVSAYPEGDTRSLSAVRDISLQVATGELFGVLGSHGAGKTTLLRLIAGELLPDSGVIQVFGLDTVQQSGLVARIVSPVRMEDSLLERLSPVENLVYSARLAGIFTQDTCLNGQMLLGALGLNDPSMNEPLMTLNALDRRKVALARALLSPVRLLLLDDPFREMEACDRQQAWQAVRRCNLQTGRTILLTSREPADVLAVCDRVIVLDRGFQIALGAPEEVLAEASSLIGDCLPLME